ncbi:MAG TPA: type II toxin-antitoxin system HicA family toxin [Thermoanaerobaculia bacterium]
MVARRMTGCAERENDGTNRTDRTYGTDGTDTAGDMRAHFGVLSHRVKVREVITTLEGDGWYLVRTRGSHRQFRHATKPGTVTVAGQLGVDVPAGTLASIWKQAGLKKS